MTAALAKKSIVMAVGLLLVILTIAVATTPPQMINYQGRLTSPTGTPFTGNKLMKFTLYNGSDIAVWNSGFFAVACTDGLFTVTLGAPGQPNMPASIFSDTAVTLGITVDVDPEITPRTKLTSQPYAFHALVADTAEVAKSFPDNSVTSAKILDGTISFGDIGQNGAALNQIMKWNGTAWVAAIDETGGGGGGAYLPLAGGIMTGPITSTGNPEIAMGKANFGTNNFNPGYSAFVAGTSDTALVDYTTVIGGYGNCAPSSYAIVAGGYRNTADGLASFVTGYHNYAAGYASVTGGANNIASGFASTIGGGEIDTAAGYYAVVAGGIANVALDSAAAVCGGNGNRATGKYSFVGGGGGIPLSTANNAMGRNSVVTGGMTNTAMGDYSAVGGGAENTSRSDYACISGGQANDASNSWAHIGAGFGNHASGLYSFIGGGAYNRAPGNYSVVAGGGSGEDTNSAQGRYSTISGGRGNSTHNDASTVGGGAFNNASGAYSTIGGGGGWQMADSNSASGAYSTISGGTKNIASGERSTVGGGYANRTTGFASVAPGGEGNYANGAWSFAAGYDASADHEGSFVWSDHGGGYFNSSAANEFSVRAIGGTRIYSGWYGSASGVFLAPGSSAWVSISDSTAKRNIRPVDGEEILSKLAQLPVSRWSYKAQDSNIEHIGPMAQDFYALFGIGESDTTISTIDPAGIALAAIKELNERNQELENQNADLQRQLDELRQMIEMYLSGKQ